MSNKIPCQKSEIHFVVSEIQCLNEVIVGEIIVNPNIRLATGQILRNLRMAVRPVPPPRYYAVRPDSRQHYMFKGVKFLKVRGTPQEMRP